jgi:hypothetical protein
MFFTVLAGNSLLIEYESSPNTEYYRILNCTIRHTSRDQFDASTLRRTVIGAASNDLHIGICAPRVAWLCHTSILRLPTNMETHGIFILTSRET